jgi:CBS domain-containing membrane protein
MKAFTKPFLKLTAADLMSCELITIPEAMSLRGAARLLARAQVTGAPVVDAEGRCIGVFSTTDLLKWTENQDRTCSRPEACVSAWQMVDAGELPEDRVGRFMTPDPVTALPGASIQDLALRMLDAHIHRLVVVDDCARPTGIVSSTDVLAAVAHAVPGTEP